MVNLSEQASVLAKNIKGLDMKDFELWWNALPSVVIIGSDKFVQYLDMKEKGMWKDGKFVVPEQRRD